MTRKQNTKKSRPMSAVRERQRLSVFNEALHRLQESMPLRLTRGRKLHKKQIVKLASKYIVFLRECMDGKQDWNDRHRFMFSMDKEDGDVINAIDHASNSQDENHSTITLRSNASIAQLSESSAVSKDTKLKMLPSIENFSTYNEKASTTRIKIESNMDTLYHDAVLGFCEDKEHFNSMAQEILTPLPEITQLDLASVLKHEDDCF